MTAMHNVINTTAPTVTSKYVLLPCCAGDAVRFFATADGVMPRGRLLIAISPRSAPQSGSKKENCAQRNSLFEILNKRYELFNFEILCGVDLAE